MFQRKKKTKAEIEIAIDVAAGRVPADLVLKGCHFLDVFSGRWIQGDIAIQQGEIVGTGESYDGKQTQDLTGQFVVPGFIDSHVHIESSLMTPSTFEKAVLPRGTTSAIIDPHEIANVLGLEGLKFFLQSAEVLTCDLFVMLSSCVPATEHLETAGARLSASDLMSLKDHPRVLGLAEMMNFPGVIGKAPEVMDKLVAFQDVFIDGHSPMVRGKDLNAYLVAGMKSCHESVSLEEAREKLQKGMQILLREGSVAKNLKELVPLLNAYSSPKISLCTDDRNPVDILDEGHVDYLIRVAIAHGHEPIDVYRAASWSTAAVYGLEGKGAIAPRYDADLVVLKDFKTVEIASVLKAGRWIRSQSDIPKRKIEMKFENTVRCEIPDLAEFQIRLPQQRLAASKSVDVRVIRVVPNQIVTKSEVAKMNVVPAFSDGTTSSFQSDQKFEVVADKSNDVLKIAVLERHGHGVPLAKGFVAGFGFQKGAIGSSVGHDSHNLVTVGTNDSDMRACLQWMKEKGGGFVAIVNGEVVAALELPLAGLMTDASLEEITQKMRHLREVTRDHMGGRLSEPFLQLAFLCLPVIPELKITDQGLIDVVQFQKVSVFSSV
ncbi:MAG: adenine deaminase [Bdellovibrionales bacterium]|nr:adenine deaminase [Bdellovibrionales bacterium]